MGEQRVRRTVGEQWSNTYRNPTFDLDDDQAYNALLVADIRRATRIALVVIVVFAIALAISGSFEAGYNLLLIAGGPIVVVAATGRLVGWYTRHGSSRHGSPDSR